MTKSPVHVADAYAAGHDVAASLLGLDRSHVTRAATGSRLTEGLFKALSVSFDANAGRYIQSSPPNFRASDTEALRAEITRPRAIIVRLNATIRGLRAALTTAKEKGSAT